MSWDRRVYILTVLPDDVFNDPDTKRSSKYTFKSISHIDLI